MRVPLVLAAVAASLVVQVTLARYAIGGRWVFDFVLVGALSVALQAGPVAGILAGTLGGLLQDMLAGGIVGVGGLAKTVVACLAGAFGTQFMLVRPGARALVIAVGTLIHRLMVVGLYAIIDQRWPGLSLGAMLAEVVLNTLAGFIVFQSANALPGLMSRQRMSRRSTFSRRQW
jgi:rod shape-determining protein MreD